MPNVAGLEELASEQGYCQQDIARCERQRKDSRIGEPAYTYGYHRQHYGLGGICYTGNGIPDKIPAIVLFHAMIIMWDCLKVKLCPISDTTSNTQNIVDLLP